MTVRVVVEAEAGSFEKRRCDERTLEVLGVRRVDLAYPYPYGFIFGTVTADGEAVDAYVITNDRLAAGHLVDCEPVGMLEVFEGDEVDHKVLACLPGQPLEPDAQLAETLQRFIQGIFKDNPEVKIRVGRLLSQQAALEYIESHLLPSR